ncbi:MAG: acyltransferase [Oscillospiraceae bacterium]|nr:acyltransferase [Oscillospiraceae bacterium]
MAQRERISSLQVVRALAFCGVFLYHAVKAFPGEGLVYDVFSKSAGRWGVSVFFCLSGFLMTFSYWDRAPEHSLKQSALFSIKKIMRLYPLHLIMLFVGAVYLYLNHESIFRIVLRLIITIPLVQTWLPDGYQAVNSVAWYLSVSLFLYFCFPCLLKLIQKNKNNTRSILVIVLIFSIQLLIGACVYQFTALDIKWITYCHPVFRLGDFAIGCLLASLYKSRKHERMDRWKCTFLELFALILNIAVCVFFTKASDDTVWFTYTSLFVPTSALLVYAFSFDRGMVSKLLKNKPVFWLAAISPYAFLIHRLVIHYFHDFVKYVLHVDQINFFFVIFVPFAISVAGVYLYFFLEKVVLRRMRREKMPE